MSEVRVYHAKRHPIIKSSQVAPSSKEVVEVAPPIEKKSEQQEIKSTPPELPKHQPIQPSQPIPITKHQHRVLRVIKPIINPVIFPVANTGSAKKILNI